MNDNNVSHGQQLSTDQADRWSVKLTGGQQRLHSADDVALQQAKCTLQKVEGHATSGSLVTMVTSNVYNYK